MRWTVKEGDTVGEALKKDFSLGEITLEDIEVILERS